MDADILYILYFVSDMWEEAMGHGYMCLHGDLIGKGALVILRFVIL